MTIRVLIADDQALVRNGITTILDNEDGISVVGEAENGRAAVELTGRLTPDLVLMDIQMPTLDGLEATRRIIESRPGQERPRVVMLTTFERDDYLFEALRSGASGFLLKNAGADELVAAVRTIAEGEALLAPSMTRRVVEHFARGPVDPTLLRNLERLTDREREVLAEVATGQSNAEIAATLVVSEATVRRSRLERGASAYQGRRWRWASLPGGPTAAHPPLLRPRRYR